MPCGDALIGSNGARELKEVARWRRKSWRRSTGSEHAWKALDLAADMAKQSGAQLIVSGTPCRTSRCTRPCGLLRTPKTCLWRKKKDETSPSLDPGRPSLPAPLKRGSRDKGLKDVVGRTVEGKPAGQKIPEVASSEGVDMIVMGNLAVSAMPAPSFLGSVSHKVANHAACTCVTVK